MSLKIKFGNWLSKRYFTYRLIPSIMIDYQTGMFGTNCDIILSWLAWSIMVESSKKDQAKKCSDNKNCKIKP